MYNYAEVNIRRADLAEVDVVKEIVKEAYAPIKKKLSRQPAALKESLDKIARHIQMGNQYVALVGELIVGTMRVSLRGQVGVISRVGVRQEFRSRRIGTKLVDYAENLLTHMNAQRIEVEIYGAVDNQVSFYERGGYVETDRIKRLGEVIVVMQKDLTESPVEEEP
ncbi:MAG: GNAT family N-acetyltransferase [Candidatus Thorarchaeota archaeon]|jgi:ribosomal protein S18 acetylase RimI-like enzyme